MVKVTSLLAKAGSRLRFSFRVRACTEMEIQCVKGMYRLKLVLSDNNQHVQYCLNSFCSLKWSVLSLHVLNPHCR